MISRQNVTYHKRRDEQQKIVTLGHVHVLYMLVNGIFSQHFLCFHTNDQTSFSEKCFYRFQGDFVFSLDTHFKSNRNVERLFYTLYDNHIISSVKIFLKLICAFSCRLASLTVITLDYITLM